MSHTYLFLGDSITDANRLWLPESNGLGNGYVSILDQYLTAQEPTAYIINKGHDGFTVSALLRSIQSDCITYRPDFVSILIGINDIGVAMNTGVSLENLHFSKIYENLLYTICTETDASLLCLGPFIFPYPQEYLLWMNMVREAEQIIAALANRYQIPFVPLHDLLNTTAKEQGYPAITTDGIHLTQNGHRILADLIYPYCNVK